MADSGTGGSNAGEERAIVEAKARLEDLMSRLSMQKSLLNERDEECDRMDMQWRNTQQEIRMRDLQISKLLAQLKSEESRQKLFLERSTVRGQLWIGAI